MLVLLYVLIIVVFLLLAIGGIIFCAACVRRKEYPWHDLDAMKSTPYGKYISYISYGTNWIKTHYAKDIYITSKDGLQLHGLWIPAENSKGTVILAHGYRSSPLADFAMAYPCYHERAMNILVPTQRAHGKSEGKLITFGVKESDDMLLWLRYHNEHLSDCPVIMSGLSMGASTMLYLADQQMPDNVKGIIADCGFTSPEQIIAKVINDTVHFDGRFLLYIAELYARLIGKFSFWEKNTCKTLSRSKYPIMIAHGLADDYVPCQMSRKAFEACGSEKYLLLVEGAAHGVSFIYDQERYIEMIDQFLNKYLLDGGHNYESGLC